MVGKAMECIRQNFNLARIRPVLEVSSLLETVVTQSLDK